MQRVVITGASGFLGRYMLETAPLTSAILALTHQNNIQATSNTTTVSLDLTSDSFDPILEFKPDVIYHLAAMSSPEACETSPQQAEKITVESTERLAKLANKLNCRLIFTSTDLVFDGENAPYNEFSKPSPINVYGRQKVVAEGVVLSEMPDKGVVVRCPLMYGGSVQNRENFTAGIVRKLKTLEPVYLFTDEYRTPAWGQDVATALWKIGASEDRGILHAGGAERLSRYEMGEQICASMNADRSLLIKSLRKDVNSSAARAKDCSIESIRKDISVSLPLPGFHQRLSILLNQH